MNKHLYMICPTEHLESLINNRFEGQKYFYTSLGMTYSLDKLTVEQIAMLIKKQYIDRVTLILSEDNAIVLDALSSQNFVSITGLKASYERLQEQKKKALGVWPTHIQHAMFLSYYLNYKINELQNSLQEFGIDSLKIDGKLYSRAYDSFRNIFSDLVCFNPNQLN